MLQSKVEELILSRDSAQIKIKKVIIPIIINLCLDKEFECCTVTVVLHSSYYFCLGGLYRTPGSFYDKL